MLKKIIFLFLPVLFVITAFASVENDIADAAKFLTDNVNNPTISSIGGEWTIIALKESKVNADAIIELYYNNAKKNIKEKRGVLAKNKYTEYSRVLLAMTALGKGPTISGYNLVNYITDYDNVVKQGINGASFALLALDFGGYAKATDVRQKYIDIILSKQLTDGGFNLSKKTCDPDITAMALRALAPYRTQKKVDDAIKKALLSLSKVQLKNGGFVSNGYENCESVSQVILALSALNINIKSSDFVKEKNLIENLLTFKKSGGFCHIKGCEATIMPTEQALMALCAFRDKEAAVKPQNWYIPDFFIIPFAFGKIG